MTHQANRQYAVFLLAFLVVAFANTFVHLAFLWAELPKMELPYFDANYDLLFFELIRAPVLIAWSIALIASQAHFSTKLFSIALIFWWLQFGLYFLLHLVNADAHAASNANLIFCVATLAILLTLALVKRREFEPTAAAASGMVFLVISTAVFGQHVASWIGNVAAAATIGLALHGHRLKSLRDRPMFSRWYVLAAAWAVTSLLSSALEYLWIF